MAADFKFAGKTVDDISQAADLGRRSAFGRDLDDEQVRLASGKSGGDPPDGMAECCWTMRISIIPFAPHRGQGDSECRTSLFSIRKRFFPIAFAKRFLGCIL